MQKFSQIIQAELKKKGLKQKDLAEYLNKSEAALSQMLANESFKPDIMIRISQFLGVDLNFFSRDVTSKSVTQPEDQENVKFLKEIIKTKDEVIESQKELIATLKSKLRE